MYTSVNVIYTEQRLRINLGNKFSPLSTKTQKVKIVWLVASRYLGISLFRLLKIESKGTDFDKLPSLPNFITKKTLFKAESFVKF